MTKKTKQQIKEAVIKIKAEHLIFSEAEAETAIRFVRDLMELDIAVTEINEPYATRSIKEMKVAAQKIMGLENLLLEVGE